MSEVVREFISAMNAAGVGPSNASEIIADDVIRRYSVEGDRSGTKNGSYRLAEDDGFGYGFFMSFRVHSEAINWHTKSKRKWSDEERAEHKRKMDAAKRARDKQRADDALAAREEAKTAWDQAARNGTSPYLTSKGVTLKGVRYEDDTCVVPMWRADGALASIQRIKPDGSKWFLKNSDHVGAYFPIAGDRDTIAICEGVSTGASVHAATGWSAICAFNAGNLKAVTVAIRSKYPDARIVIAADNDHAATNAKGEPWNVGIEKAGQAAVAIGGAQVVAPDALDGVSDWNDIHALYGLDAVREGLMRAPDIRPDHTPMDDGGNWEPDYDEIGPSPEEVDELMVIRPLGHNRGTYYFFPRSTGQIMEFSATSLGRPQTLYMLAPRSFWNSVYGADTKMSEICEYASENLIAECHRKGIFSIENARGVGVWKDRNGKLLVNCGDVIVGEGVRCHPSEYNSEAVYEAGHKVIDLDVDPLTAKEASRFRGICKSLTWKKLQYGDFLAGWCVIAAVGGAVSWRPHIFITGRKGSGKSTAMDKIVMGALKDIAIKRDGGTSEAGIRKAIGQSSRPFIMDEAEGESSNRRASMQLILEYFRNASSGAVMENAYATYVARSAACFGAINPRIEQGADGDRWSILELMPNTARDRDEHYKRLLSDISDVITDDFADRLLARTVANLDVLLHNIGVFVDVFSTKLGSKRAGDQVGTLIAGSYSLTSSNRVTYDFVEDWVSKQDWEWSELTGGDSDAEALVSHIMESRVKYDVDGMIRESVIGEMVWIANNPTHQIHTHAVKGLASIGIKIEDDRLLIANKTNGLTNIMKSTVWGTNWKRVLGDIEGADNCDGKVVYFSHGVKSRAVAIPLDAAIGDGSDGEEWTLEGFE